ncbi:MAG: Uma2 family endonuclease [Planctomycetes bacterium]|nr:Uma2 family endonuclease [Planctomycetota bacterium]
MPTFVYESAEVSIPDWVVDLESFRRWADADDFPEKERIWYLPGGVWVDMSKEQIFTHVLIKTEITIVVGGLVTHGGLGMYLTDGAFFSNEEADIGGKPDGLFASNASLDEQKVRMVEGMETGHLEIEGTPDMVLEVVSESSVRKDKIVLREAYWKAGIREYWLVDARKETLSFDILRHTAKGYVATRKQQGWIKSNVFSKSFRLTSRTDSRGNLACTLAVR